jgi:hypothetical protein
VLKLNKVFCRVITKRANSLFSLIKTCPAFCSILVHQSNIKTTQIDLDSSTALSHRHAMEHACSISEDSLSTMCLSSQHNSSLCGHDDSSTPTLTSSPIQPLLVEGGGTSYKCRCRCRCRESPAEELTNRSVRRRSDSINSCSSSDLELVRIQEMTTLPYLPADIEEGMNVETDNCKAPHQSPRVPTLKMRLNKLSVTDAAQSFGLSAQDNTISPRFASNAELCSPPLQSLYLTPNQYQRSFDSSPPPPPTSPNMIFVNVTIVRDLCIQDFLESET